MAGVIAGDKAVILQTVLDEKMQEGAISGFMEANASMYKYTGGKTIQIADIVTDGLTDYDRTSGFGTAGAVTLTFTPHVFEKDRAQNFLLDSMEVDETNFLACATTTMTTFQKTEVIPEIDAYRFSKIYEIANEASKVGQYTPVVDTIFEQLTLDIATVQDGIGASEPLVILMSTLTANKLNNADKVVKNLDMATFSQGGVNTQVTSLDGTPILKVPSSSLKTLYTFTPSGSGGFVANAGALGINWIIMAKKSVVAITKTDISKIITPELNQTADAYKIMYRKFHTLFIPKNKVAGVYVSYTPADAVASAEYTLLTAYDTTTITLTQGTYKTAIAMTDFSFAGTDAVALAASTLVRTSDTVVTLTHATTLVGTNNIITLAGTGQELQATVVTPVGTTA